MYIGRIMHTNLITVSPQTTLVGANKLIKEKRIDHLLVVNQDGKLVGLVSDRDLKQNWASPATALSTHELHYLLEKVEVGMIMTRTVVTISASTTIERAAYIMQQNRISSLPVMEEDKLVGIITSTDVMEVLLQAIGMGNDSSRLSIFVQDTIGSLAKITATLKDAQINIQSLITWPEKDYLNISQLVIRVDEKDCEKAISVLEMEGIKVKCEYAKDITPFLPI